MPDSAVAPAFVIKPRDLHALNYLAPDHPRPCASQWIDRGTNKRLQPSSVAMLMRTLSQDIASPSVVRLHRAAGLRVTFDSAGERDAFAAAICAARKPANEDRAHRLTAMFGDRREAEEAMAMLARAGIAEEAMTLLWRANQLTDTDFRWRQGHTRRSVSGATGGGAIAGLALGVALLAVPGVGPIAAAGALASAGASSVAAVSAIIGATGGAITRMLSDHDVDGVSANGCEQHLARGRVYLSIDTRRTGEPRSHIADLLSQNGGRISKRA